MIVTNWQEEIKIYDNEEKKENNNFRRHITCQSDLIDKTDALGFQKYWIKGKQKRGELLWNRNKVVFDWRRSLKGKHICICGCGEDIFEQLHISVDLLYQWRKTRIPIYAYHHCRRNK